MQHVNTGLSNEPGASSSRGHMHVCILCGSSLRSRKRDLIVRENPSQLQQAIRIEIENTIAPRQVIMMIFCYIKQYLKEFIDIMYIKTRRHIVYIKTRSYGCFR